MESTVITIAFIVLLGFQYWIHSKHIQRLEVFLKAHDLSEAKAFSEKRPGDDAGIKRQEEQQSLTELVDEKTPDQIRAMFGGKTAQPDDPADEQSTT